MLPQRKTCNSVRVNPAGAERGSMLSLHSNSSNREMSRYITGLHMTLEMVLSVQHLGPEIHEHTCDGF